VTGNLVTFEVPASSYLLHKEDYSGVEMCHVTVFGQAQTDLDYWVLGEAFMQNHYVVFDGSERDETGQEILKIGMPHDDLNNHSLFMWVWFGAIIILVLIIVISIIGLQIKKSKQNKTQQ